MLAKHEKTADVRIADTDLTVGLQNSTPNPHTSRTYPLQSTARKGGTAILAKHVKTADVRIADTDLTVGLPNSTFKDLREAFYEVPDGGTLWVGPGEHRVYGLDFYGRSIRLVSTHGPEETHIIGEDSTHPVLVFQNDEEPECIVEGFTIRNGNGPYGGGMFVRGASPTIKNVIFQDNKAKYGGGVFVCRSASPKFLNVTMKNNSAERGGGMYCYDSYPDLDRVTFYQNQAEYGGGLELRYPCVGVDLPMRSVMIWGNKASKLGGGVMTNSHPTDFRQAIFHENQDTDLVFQNSGFVEEYPIYE